MPDSPNRKSEKQAEKFNPISIQSFLNLLGGWRLYWLPNNMQNTNKNNSVVESNKKVVESFDNELLIVCFKSSIWFLWRLRLMLAPSDFQLKFQGGVHISRNTFTSSLPYLPPSTTNSFLENSCVPNNIATKCLNHPPPAYLRELCDL